MLDEQRVAVGGRRALDQAVLAPGLVKRCVRTLGRHKTLLPYLFLVVPMVVSLRPSKPGAPSTLSFHSVSYLGDPASSDKNTVPFSPFAAPPCRFCSAPLSPKIIVRLISW